MAEAEGRRAHAPLNFGRSENGGSNANGPHYQGPPSNFGRSENGGSNAAPDFQTIRHPCRMQRTVGRS